VDRAGQGRAHRLPAKQSGRCVQRAWGEGTPLRGHGWETGCRCIVGASQVSDLHGAGAEGHEGSQAELGWGR
jgi:hypothetical protein